MMGDIATGCKNCKRFFCECRMDNANAATQLTASLSGVLLGRIPEAMADSVEWESEMAERLIRESTGKI